MEGDIIKYQVVRCGMYGDDVPITGDMDSLDEAIRLAKQFNGASVNKKVYASQENYERGFTLMTLPCASAWNDWGNL